MPDARPINRVVQRLNDTWAIARPSIWMVSLLPYFTGYLLASHRFLPATVGDFVPFAIGALVLGPGVWLAVLAINDAVDLPGDLQNPRKAESPLTNGRVSARDATVLAYGAAGLCLALALVVGFGLFLVTLAFLVLGWAYSLPPVRLKDRAGWDIAANAIAIGGFVLVGGWSVAAPVGDFPWIFVLEGFLVTTAVYIPTTLADYEADVTSGYRTVAVRLGRYRTHLIGLFAMAASCAIAITLSALDYVIPQRMLWIQVVAGIVISIVYHLVLGRARTWRQVVFWIVLVSWLFMALNGTFALMYVGWI